ncbi:MAG: hypothetical protein COW02_11510, partial [Comamonadaceae bacterium CG12_big_fil_rev_8_21_14_0_65_59_15]
MVPVHRRSAMRSHASLNHIYRSVWNQALGAMVAVAEICPAHAGTGAASGSVASASWPMDGFESLRLKTLASAVALVWTATCSVAFANPTGGVTVAGQASMVSQGNKLTVTTQNAPGANHSAINWQSFSIPQGNSTYFAQPNAASTVINRVVTHTPSQLFGTLGSNGSLVLVNQAGITVGAGAVVDTAGFTASALRMSDADALAGRLKFGEAGALGGAVTANGNILARSGDVVLIGAGVGTGQKALIQSPNGATMLVAGSAVSISARGLEGIQLEVQAPSDSAVNLGTLQGDAVGIFAGTLKHSGAIQATTAALEGGKVVLRATGDTYVEGAGKIAATGIHGGSVDVLGNRVAVTDQAQIDVSGDHGGGTVRIGGDYQGKNAAVPNAQYSYFGPEASVHADATDSGDGGKVIVWADKTTRAYGNITAKGGVNGGNGGLVETSGHHLDVAGIKVNALAPHGSAGSWLLDPSDINVLATGFDASPLTGSGLLGGVDLFANTGLSAGNVSNLNIATINTASANVTLQALNDITFGAPVSIAAAGVGLTAQAGNNIAWGSNTITTNGGALAFSANDAGGTQTGTGSISGTGTITTNGGAVSISGQNISLLDVSTLAASGGAVTLTAGNNGTITAGTIATSGGNGAPNAVSAGGNAGAVTITGAAGNLTLAALTVNTVGGTGSATDTVGIVGGKGGNGGDVTMTAANNGLLTLGAVTVTTSGGKGGDATVASAVPGNGGNPGTVTLGTNTGSGGIYFSGNTSVTSYAGFYGDAVTPAGSTGFYNNIYLRAGTGGISQASGTVVNLTSASSLFLNSLGSVVLANANNGFDYLYGSVTGDLSLVNVYGSSNLDVSGNASLSGKSWYGFEASGALTVGGNADLVSYNALTLTGAISAVGNLSLSANAAVTQNAALTASGLELKGSGSYTLTNVANNVATLATTTGAGAISYVDADALAVGIVNATTGINSTGNVSLSSAGSLTVNAPISTTGGYGGTVSLRADMNAVCASDSASCASVTFSGAGSLGTSAWTQADIYYNPAAYATPTDFSSFVGSTPLTAWMLVNDVGSSTATRGLQAMATNLAGNYALGKSIDASATSGWNGGFGFVPVGTNSTQFTGSINGAGHVISGLTINRPGSNYVGLLGYAAGAKVSNLGLESANITGGGWVGGIAGYATGIALQNTWVNGVITGTGSNVGGLVGQNDGLGTISSSYSSGSVTGSTAATASNTGGLAGWSNGSISNSYSTAAVSGNNRVGGLVGLNWGAAITNTYASGLVTGTGTTPVNVGALLGGNGTYDGTAWNGKGTVTNSFWDSSVNTTAYDGNVSAVGIGGAGAVQTGATGLATGQLNQASYTGFDFTTTWWMSEGNTRPMLRSEYNTSVGNAHQLQLMALDLAASYTLANDIDASSTNGTINPSGIWGSAGFVPLGVNPDSLIGGSFTGTLDGANHSISQININRPTQDNVGLIGYLGDSSVASVGSISNLSLQSVNITGYGMVGALAGTANGSVSGVRVSGSVTGGGEVGGVIGRLGGAATQLDNSAIVTGNDVYAEVGGVVGMVWGGSLGSASNTGAVTLTDDWGHVGGLVGRLYAGSISNSANFGSVSSTGTSGTGTAGYGGNVGGLIGRVEASGTAVSQSLSTGRVTGLADVDTVGGLIGTNSGTSNINSSFWDTETSGQTAAGAGLGLSTAQLQTTATFNSATTANGNINPGWDLSSTWGVIDGVSYPYLRALYSGTPQILSGRLLNTDGSTALSGGALQLLKNGGTWLQPALAANSTFYTALAPSSVASGDLVLAYLTGVTLPSAAVRRSDGGHLNGLNVVFDALSLTGAGPSQTLTNSQIKTASASLSTDLPYSLTETSTGSGVFNLQLNGGARLIGQDYGFGGALSTAGGSVTLSSSGAQSVGSISTQGGSVSVTALSIQVDDTINASGLAGAGALQSGGAYGGGAAGAISLQTPSASADTSILLAANSRLLANGGAGQDGTNPVEGAGLSGGAGGAAGMITLNSGAGSIDATAVGIELQAVGGAGGKGGAGVKGLNSSDPMYVPGMGSDGGAGGAGGAGAAITLQGAQVSLGSSGAAAVLKSAGGVGGAGGTGGAGGDQISFESPMVGSGGAGGAGGVGGAGGTAGNLPLTSSTGVTGFVTLTQAGLGGAGGSGGVGGQGTQAWTDTLNTTNTADDMYYAAGSQGMSPGMNSSGAAGSSGYLQLTNSAAGAVAITSSGDITLGGSNALGSASVSVQAANLTLASGASLSTSASGDAVQLAGQTSFTNAAGASALSTPNGRWLIWSADPSSISAGGLTEAFRQYAATFGSTAVQSSTAGNGFLYTEAPSLSATLTESVTGAATKVYDGNTSVGSGMALTVSGAVHSDMLSISGSLAYASPRAVASGQYVAINASALSVSATNGTVPVYGYSVPASASFANGVITPAPLTATLSNTGVSKVYDGSTSAPTGFTPAWTVSGLVSGDSAASVSHNSTLFASQNVATIGNTLTLSGLSLGSITGTLGSVASDYVLSNTEASITASITPKPLTLSASKTYDGSTSLAGAVTLIGLVNSQTLGYTATANDAHVATASKFINAITLADAVDSSGGLASNYQLPAPLDASTASVTINPATLTATLSNTGVTKQYDGGISAPAGFSPSYTFTGLVSGDTAASLSHSTAAYLGKDVATANNTLTVIGLALSAITGNNSSATSDYALNATSASVAASITPKPLTGSITGGGSVYGAPLAAGMVSLNGVLVNETVTPGVVTVSTTNMPTSTSGNYWAGTYPSAQSASTVLGGADAANYSFAGATANYTITPLTLTVTSIDPVSTTYGTSAAAGAVSFGNLISGDVVTATASIVNPLTSTSGNLKAGSYSQSVAASLGG